MKTGTALPANRLFLGTVFVFLCLHASPKSVQAQAITNSAPQGDKAIWLNATTIGGSSAIIDASAFCEPGSCQSANTDFCHVLNNALQTIPSASAGAVVDARGVVPSKSNPPGGQTMRCSDDRGHLYGTAAAGGNLSDCGLGCGLVFELKPNLNGTWKENVLYAFTGKRDGRSPVSRMIFDAAGNLYGATLDGGDFQGCTSGGQGCGVVFELERTPNGGWKEKVLYVFTGRKDGGNSYAGLTLDASGNLYGTTEFGGQLNCGEEGCGVVFEIAP